MKKHAFHAVLVQYGHDITSGERLNVGVILMCHAVGFAGARFARKLSRVSKAFPDVDIQALRSVGKELESAARNLSRNKHLEFDKSTADAHEFYYSVMPKMDSAILLTDPVQGVTMDPEKTLNSLYVQYVGKYIDLDERPLREDADIWRDVVTRLERHQVNPSRLMEKRVEGRHYEFTFQHAWKNGRWKAVQPLSFDLSNPNSIVEKAAKWSGKMRALHLQEADISVIILVGQPARDDKRFISAAADGLALLSEELDGHAQVVSETNAESVAEQIAHDLGRDRRVH